jgi:hypothetical protein
MWRYRSSGHQFRANSILLSMASPILHKMICGSFREGMTRQVVLEDVDWKAFEAVLDMWCGKDGRTDKALRDVMTMASVADRLQMLEVLTALEDAIICEIGVNTSAELLMESRRLGLKRVEEASWSMVVRRFQEVSGTTGFLGLDEETVGRVLEEDDLGVRREEEALKGLLLWMKGGEGQELRGRKLLSNIRFGMMKPDFLVSKAHEMLPKVQKDWIESLVVDELRVRCALQTNAPVELEQLGAKSQTRRRGVGVDWHLYSKVGGRILKGHSAEVLALAECSGWMCSGSLDGSIRLWNMETLREERVFNMPSEDVGDWDSVNAFAVWEGQLMSGHASGKIQVWDVASGLRLQMLMGHDGPVIALCICGSRLVSASKSESDAIKVWRIGSELEWLCERTLALKERESVTALVALGDKLVSCTRDLTIENGRTNTGDEVSDTICVWDLETGSLNAAPIRCAGTHYATTALLVDGGRLYSASQSGSITVWDVDTWTEVTSVAASLLATLPRSLAASLRLLGPELDAFNSSTFKYPGCLSMSGSKLISGSIAGQHGPREDTRYEVRVWDTATMSCEHVVLEAAGAQVCPFHHYSPAVPFPSLTWGNCLIPTLQCLFVRMLLFCS